MNWLIKQSSKDEMFHEDTENKEHFKMAVLQNYSSDIL